MIGALPLFMRKSKVYYEIFNSEDKQFLRIDTNIDDIRLQLSVDTATWGLEIYESELGIRTDTTKSLLERRSVIKSKMRGHGKVDSTLIKLVVDAFTQGSEEVSFTGTIHIKFVSVRGVPDSINEIETSLNEIIPAHLGILFEYTYLTWDELDGALKTWNDIDSYTWDQLETAFL
jgi:hypothetical protein